MANHQHDDAITARDLYCTAIACTPKAGHHFLNEIATDGPSKMTDKEEDQQIQITTPQGATTIAWREVHSLIESIRQRDPEESDSQIIFHSLDPKQRSTVHKWAEQAGLEHESQGEGEQRVLMVSKKSRAGHREKPKRNKYGSLPSGMSEIIPGFLYLGSCRDARDRQALASSDVKFIVNCALEWMHETEGIQIHRMDWEDTTSQVITESIQLGLSFLDQVRADGGKVLVHCMVGKSRSASLVVAYLMHRENMSLRQALDHTKNCRDIIRPNQGFLRQLLGMELELLKQPSLTLEEYAILFPGVDQTGGARKRREEADKKREEAAAAFCEAHVTVDKLDYIFYNVFGEEEKLDVKDVGRFIVAVKGEFNKDGSWKNALAAAEMNLSDIGTPVSILSKTFFVNKIGRG
ncbi:hypothetical protein PROFUN_11636 [Planoprotostelium fungivorum]|uniref:protein-tyrosine-phosphatase n=1 Tax=Planoprotostelium fungivorum TaxID=1890364 RepID=A0A2P6N9Q3_9EUKA|nr:hypothetical protein PROFUN_11636 [Planoprotostelium fungivorum]